MEQESITIYIPSDLLQQAKQLRADGESFNKMVIEAIAREVERQQAKASHQRIVARSAEVEARTGVQASSVTLIRQLREGEGLCRRKQEN